MFVISRIQNLVITGFNKSHYVIDHFSRWLRIIRIFLRELKKAMKNQLLGYWNGDLKYFSVINNISNKSQFHKPLGLFICKHYGLNYYSLISHGYHLMIIHLSRQFIRFHEFPRFELELPIIMRRAWYECGTNLTMFSRNLFFIAQ